MTGGQHKIETRKEGQKARHLDRNRGEVFDEGGRIHDTPGCCFYCHCCYVFFCSLSSVSSASHRGCCRQDDYRRRRHTLRGGHRTSTRMMIRTTDPIQRGSPWRRLRHGKSFHHHQARRRSECPGPHPRTGKQAGHQQEYSKRRLHRSVFRSFSFSAVLFA